MKKRKQPSSAEIAGALSEYWDQTVLRRYPRVIKAVMKGRAIEERDCAALVVLLEGLLEKERHRLERIPVAKLPQHLAVPIAVFLVRKLSMKRAAALQAASHGLVLEAAGIRAMTRLNARRMVKKGRI